MEYPHGIYHACTPCPSDKAILHWLLLLGWRLWPERPWQIGCPTEMRHVSATVQQYHWLGAVSSHGRQKERNMMDTVNCLGGSGLCRWHCFAIPLMTCRRKRTGLIDSQVGLHTSPQKTKVLPVNISASLPIKVGQLEFETTQQFTFLGSTVCNDGGGVGGWHRHPTEDW